MRDVSEANITDAVLAKQADCDDPRLREIMTALIRHLHAFAREIELTPEEWFEGIRFLTRTGQICDDQRQEFVLLSDVLGLSILVDAIANSAPGAATESSVLGPFHRAGAPEKAFGESIAVDTDGVPCTISGRVRDLDGNAISDALLDVWQTAPNGLYETQDPDQPDFNLRGRFRTDADGRYAFRTVQPSSYPIPDDGPVGALLAALGRGIMRPAHIHAIASAPGYRPVTTMLFTEGDPYLENDAVFGVKDSLVVAYRDAGDGTVEAAFDFVLVPDAAA